MTPNEWIPLAIVFSSLGPGLLIFFLMENQVRTRIALNLFGAIAKLVLVVWAFVRMRQGEDHRFEYNIAVDLGFLLRIDELSVVFALLSSVLWLVTTLYAIGYLESSPNRRRFFGFFSICVTASTGIALSGNWVTFFFFYEFLTLATYPLVVHRGTEAAVKAGRTYLWYTIGGGSILFVGVVGHFVLVGPVEFGATDSLAALADGSRGTLVLLFWVLIAGLGVKAALVPLHGWLPVAMVAPAPVSALLHAVAVVKAGAFGIMRLVHDIYGIELCRELNVLPGLAILAAVTILYGSVRALAQDDLKKRLAYSTVSQLSYITLGLAIPGMLCAVGAVVHLVHQGLMKITLFFCAGTITETVGVKKVSQMSGMGRRMPLTMAAFTVGALGMIGLPPMAGFVSKWYLGIGALEAGSGWVVAVLLASSALNAGYFLPILYKAWFEEPECEWQTKRPSRFEAPWALMVPLLFTAMLAVVAGGFAMSEWSPLSMAKEIAEGWHNKP